MEEFDRAIKRFDETGKLPLSEIDAFERRGKEALRDLARVAQVDISGLIQSRADLVQTLREYVAMLNGWVRVLTAAWVTTVIGTFLLTNLTSTMKPRDITPIAITFAMMLYFRWDRRRELRRSCMTTSDNTSDNSE